MLAWRDEVIRIWAPFVCGLVSFTFVWWMWGSLNQVAPVHDDAAYILQARIFASGHLVAPARQGPEFFEQYHTFVEPVVAAKYPPGFSLLMVPGIWFGLPGLIPALLVGLSSALACALASALSNTRVAILTVVLMNTTQVALRFNASYSSEIATGFLILLSWWALYNHWTAGHTRWLILLAAAMGWGAITRPLTMLAFAAPTAIGALLSIRRHSAWRAIAPSFLAALAPILFMLLFNSRVTGSWKVFPHSEYARLYTPADHMGFGTSGVIPVRTLSTEEHAFNALTDSLHEAHTAANLPTIAERRVKTLIRQVWTRQRLGLVIAVLGLFALPLGVAIALVTTVVGIFAAYLLYAFVPIWVVYYLELQAPLAFLTALGVFQAGYLFTRFALPILSSRISPRGVEPPPPISDVARARWAWATYALVAAWLLWPVPQMASVTRHIALTKAAYWGNFRQFVASLPTKRAVVFVRYGRGHVSHASLVQNEPFGGADVWIVHDRGVDNERLMRFAQDRVPYLYTETNLGSKVSGHITPLDREPAALR